MPNRLRQLVLGALLASAVVLAVGCAPSQASWDWRWDVVEADRLADEERYSEAMARYSELLPQATDGFERRYVTYRMGFAQEQQEHWEEAIAYYLQLLEHRQIYDPIEDYTPRALFRVGLILYDELDRPDEGLKIWRHVIHYYPDAEGPAWRALDSIISHYQRTGEHRAAARFFAREYRALQNTRIGDNLLYWLAYWHRHYLDEPETALELNLMMRERYWESSLRDQADWETIELLHERGEYEREWKMLRALASEREGSLVLGPYVTWIMEEAAFRAGTVRLENLDDPGGAIEDWESFLGTWSLSLLRDDAAKGIVDAALAIGDSTLIRDKARWFLEDFPESRYVDEVAAILERHGGALP